MERKPSIELGMQQEAAGDRAAERAAREARPIHPKLAGRAQTSALGAEVPEPDAIRPDSSPEWRELFRQVRRAVDRLRV